MKSIILMCDGTSNSIGQNVSNVVRLYRCLEKTDAQRVFYNPGVGTIGGDGWWSERLRRAKAVFELATAWGIDRDICRTYQFLCETFEPGDRIYMFGFSRGAYTVRVVAALVHMVGVLKPDQVNLIPHVLRAYKQLADRDADEALKAEDYAPVDAFADVLDPRWTPVHFLGLFDTVSSVIVPGRRFFGLLPGTSRLLHTRTNPSVRAVWHAVAIDERRRMFRSNRWLEGKKHRRDRFKADTEVDQIVNQVWFAGVHADVGGGYPEAESGLAKLALRWLVRAAQADDLYFIKGRVERFVLGKNRPDSADNFCEPSAEARIHKSLKGVWWVAELLPKRSKFRETRMGSFLGFYLPVGEPRRMVYRDAPTLQVHESVEQRRKSTVANYQPANLPQQVELIADLPEPKGLRRWPPQKAKK